MRNSKNLFLCIILLLGVSGCQLATFNARPGVGVSSYPKELHGTWRAIERHDGVKDTHLVVISDKGVKMDDATMDKALNLSDTNNTLSHLGDFYFLNVREMDSAGSPYWIIYPFEFDNDHLYVYCLSMGKTQKKLNKYLKTTGRRDGYFMMEDQAFKKYCEKHLKRRKALKLTRIK
jgi:hypothetical protein